MLPATIISKAPSVAPDSKRLPAYFTREEVRQILTFCFEQRETDIFFLIDFFWRTGVRVSEAIAVTAEDIDFTSLTINIRSLRRRDGHVRVIPIRPDFAAEITVWIQRKRLLPTERLFPITRKTAYNWVVWACRGAGFIGQRIHPQTLRHSFAVNLLSQGMPVAAVQEYLGHKDLAETLVYTRLINTDPRKLFSTLQF